MKNNNVTFKDGTPLTKNGKPVQVDTSFTIIQANALGTVGPAANLVSQTQINQFLLDKIAQLLAVPARFTANTQTYVTTKADLGAYAAYLPKDFTVSSTSSEGDDVTQALADAKALAKARQKALNLITLNAVLRTPNTSGNPLFSGVNAALLAV